MAEKKADKIDHVEEAIQKLVDKMGPPHLDYHKYEPEIEELKESVEKLK